MIKRSVPFSVFLILISGFLFAQTQIIYPEGLKPGDAAPAFKAKDQDGKNITLKDALMKGPVVMLFYRGQWCPHCSRQLSHFSDSLRMITEKGAIVLAVTPETSENIKKTIGKTGTSFSILEDEGMAIMRSYKVNFAVDEKTVTRYKGYGIDFEQANGTNGANLPVPATYIIGTDGKIRYAFFNTDYRKRASVKDILDKL